MDKKLNVHTDCGQYLTTIYISFILALFLQLSLSYVVNDGTRLARIYEETLDALSEKNDDGSDISVEKAA